MDVLNRGIGDSEDGSKHALARALSAGYPFAGISCSSSLPFKFMI